MIDPDLKKQLDLVNKNLYEINRKTGSSLWRSFVSGTLSGLGSVIGVAIALAIIGWILNTVGIIPAFREQVHNLQQSLDQIKKGR